MTDFDDRLLRFLEGKATPSEREDLERELAASSRLRTELEDARRGLEAMRGLAADPDLAVPPLADASWERAMGRDAPRRVAAGARWRRAAVIAALLLLPTSGWVARGWVEPDPVRLPPAGPVTPAAGTPDPQMRQYLLLFTGAWSDMAALPPDARFEREEAYMSWIGELEGAGRLVTGGELGSEPGLFLTSGGMGVAEFIPDLEPDEIVVGFVVIRAEDDDEARRIAAACPHVRYGSGVLMKGVGPGM